VVLAAGVLPCAVGDLVGVVLGEAGTVLGEAVGSADVGMPNAAAGAQSESAASGSMPGLSDAGTFVFVPLAAVSSRW
jgi:hypothetical protein